MSENDNTLSNETVEEVEESFSDVELDLDELIHAEFPDDPAMQGTHTGLPHYAEILKHLPDSARRLVQNLRSSYTQKTQQIAEERRQLDEFKRQVAAEREILLSQDWTFNDDEVERSDTSSSETDAERRIQEAVQKALQARFAPLKEKHEQQQRAMELQRFKQENPDLEDLREDITELLLSRPELHLQDAYLIAKGKRVTEQTRAARVQQRTVQSRISGGSVGSNPKGKPPSDMRDPYEIYLFHKQQSQGK